MAEEIKRHGVSLSTAELMDCPYSSQHDTFST